MRDPNTFRVVNDGWPNVGDRVELYDEQSRQFAGSYVCVTPRSNGEHNGKWVYEPAALQSVGLTHG
jgi:hypothetical protein